MCVKQFFGYNCGHCSIPHLMLCPLAASNPFFPTCAYPAERPLFTDTFCHPCSRIVWNARVLREEEEHRGRHLRGECSCEVKFEGEQREKWSKDGPANQTREGASRGRDSGRLAAQESAATLAGVTGEAYPGFAHQGWAPQGPYQQQADYLGYYSIGEHMQTIDPNLSYTMSVGMQGNRGQLMMGEMGSRMKWYADSAPFAEPSPSLQPSPLHNNTLNTHNIAAPANPAKESSARPAEPAEPAEPGGAGGDAEEQPVVVSSGTVGRDST